MGQNRYPKPKLIKRLFNKPLRCQAVVNIGEPIGKIDRNIYGQQIDLNEIGFDDTSIPLGEAGIPPGILALVKQLHPPIIRCILGKGSDDSHQKQADQQFLTQLNAFFAFCNTVGADPTLVIDTENCPPKEAAQWVSYCNDPAGTQMGRLRAEFGQPEPYRVYRWGLGNPFSKPVKNWEAEALAYVEQIRPIIEAIHAADPGIALIVPGIGILEGDPQTARTWNHTLLKALADQIQFLSFNWVRSTNKSLQSCPDPEALYHNVLAVTLRIESAIADMASQIKHAAPGSTIEIAMEDYSVMLPQVHGQPHTHNQIPTLRDALYIAGMLNGFHRQSKNLKMASFSRLINSQSVIINPPNQPAFPSPLYFPFKLYNLMERQVLKVTLWSPNFQVQGMGLSIYQPGQVPYVDVTATRSEDGMRIVLGIINRHPTKAAKLLILFKGEDKNVFRSKKAWLLTGPDPLATNTVAAPDKVGIRQIKTHQTRFGFLDAVLPPASLLVLPLEK